MICNAKTTGKTDQDPKTMLLLQALKSVLSRLQKREIAFHPIELIDVINTLEETSESQEEDAFYAFETIFQALDAYSDVGALGRDFMNMFGSECSDSENRKQTTYCFELKLDEVDSADSSTQATTSENLFKIFFDFSFSRTVNCKSVYYISKTCTHSDGQIGQSTRRGRFQEQCQVRDFLLKASNSVGPSGQPHYHSTFT